MSLNGSLVNFLRGLSFFEVDVGVVVALEGLGRVLMWSLPIVGVVGGEDAPACR